MITGAYRGDDPWDLESYWYAWDGTPLSDYNDSCDVTLYKDGRREAQRQRDDRVSLHKEMWLKRPRDIARHRGFAP